MRIAPLSDPTDEDLVAELRKTRSESAFRDLHHRHTPRLLRIAQRMLGDSDVDAEDVVQEAWIRALGSLESFRGESRFGTWLVRIAINVAVEHVRKAARARLVALDAAAHATDRQPPHEVRLDLERIIALLPVGCRTVLLLHDVEGYTHLEIGRMLGIAEGTSKSQLNLARHRAQALFDGGTRATGVVTPAVPEDDWLVAEQGEVVSQ
jgi:RNA polymerase sigma-70 factor (ECF subfamily)